MILRRISEHIRTQNWFAVTIEFLIVVAGVFMGLQVQDWNEARKERNEEQDLLSRLHEETRGLIDEQHDMLEHLSDRADVLMHLNAALFSNDPSASISEKECYHIVASHVFRRSSDELPVLDEMLSTGRFDVLQDKSIKAHLRNYVLFRERARAYYIEATNELFRLHSRFPELIQLGRRASLPGAASRMNGLSGDGFEWTHDCDLTNMRTNSAFLNEYVDNLSRISSMIKFTEQRKDHLEALEVALSNRPDIAERE